MPKAAEQDGSTFEPADKDKQRTYPARGGLRVTTFAAETYGRMSEPMLDTMRELALYAAQADRARGLQARRRAAGWRASASTVLAKCAAEAWLASTAYPIGRAPHHRVAPEPEPPADTGPRAGSEACLPG